MKALTINKTYPDENQNAAANKEMRKCVQYAFHNNIMIIEDFEITDANKTELLLDIALMIDNAKGATVAILTYEPDNLLVDGLPNIFIPLVASGQLEIHIVRYGLRFHQDSPHEQLTENGFKAMTEQAFWAELFEDYDKKLIPQ